MKKYLIVTIFLVLTITLMSPVSASAKTKAGTKSGSFFYFFDKAFEKTNLFFTFSAEKKAKKALEYAEERLAEAEESANENKPEAVAEAMENFQENIEILEKVFNKVPEEAKEAIEKAIEASKKGKEETEEVIEKANELEKKSEIKKETEEANSEIKKEENDDEEENEEETEISDDKKKETNKKDEQKKEIEKLKKEVEILKQKQPQIKIIEKIEKIIEKPIIIEKIVEKPALGENKQSSSSQTKQNENIVTLPNGAVVEMDASGNVVRTIKEAQNNYINPSAQNSSHFFVHKTLSVVPRDYSSDLLLHDAKTNLRLISIRFLAGGDTETSINGVPTQLAHSVTDTHINNIHIKLNGAASISVIKNLRVLAGNDTRVSGDYTFDNNGEVFLPTSITVPSGESRDYIIAVDVADNNSLEQGKSISISIISIDSDAEVNTPLPITGYSYKIVSSQISIQSQVCNLATTNLKTDYFLDNLLQNSNNDGRIFMNAYILNSFGENYYNSNPSAIMTITTSNHSNDKTLNGSGNTGPCGYYYPYEFYTRPTA